MGKVTETTLGDIGCTKDTLLKDVMEAIYNAGKAEGHKEGFNEGYKQCKSEPEAKTFERDNETYEMEVQH